jgi:hypothetical protein
LLKTHHPGGFQIACQVIFSLIVLAHSPESDISPDILLAYFKYDITLNGGPGTAMSRQVSRPKLK